MTKMINKTAVLLLLISFIVVRSLAQEALPDILQKQFTTYQQSHLQEKLFVHTDKDVYFVGESCWFKIYAVDAFFHTPLSISKVVYIELLDKNHKPVWQSMIGLEGGLGQGSVRLPADINSNHYTLRAYTNWMKNFGADYFFEKTLTVINTEAVYESEKPAPKESYTTKFFPEGGNLVNGIQSTVAVHIVNQYGKGVEHCLGDVLNNKNEQVAHFETAKFGMGKFLFTPKANETYTAVLLIPNDKTMPQKLPAAFANGYVMHLEAGLDNQIKVMVKASAQNTSSTVYLFAHTRGVTKAVLSAPMTKDSVVFTIDRDKIGAGITHFTVFDANKQPVCERLYFKQLEQYLQIDMQTDAVTYATRKKINIGIKTSDQLGKPVSADMSMAVYRLDSLQGQDPMTINNYLWLRSDLVGNIESPEYYFTHSGQETDEALDKLMLTQGWRRFQWSNILEDKKSVFEFLPEHVAPLITGNITHKESGLPARNVETFLSVPNTRTPFRPAISDEKGRIQFEMKNFYKDSRIIVQANNAQDSAYTIAIKNPYSERFLSYLPPLFSLINSQQTALQSHYKSMQVQNTFGKQSQLTPISLVDTTAFYLKPDATYLLDNYVRFTTLEEVLTEYVTPLSMKRRNNKVHLQVWDALRNKFFDPDPLVLLDGMPILDKDKFINYDPLKIKQLDIVTRMYYWGNMSFSGILNFMTYTGNIPDYVLDPQTTVMDYKGLQEQRVFYAPEYAAQQQVESRLPDFRNLLHWAPSVKTNEKGEQQLGFYSSDWVGQYIVVLQGLTKDGKTGYGVKKIDVK